jgi:hypothetical protein
MESERIKELITFQRANLANMEMAAQAFGGGAFMEATAKIAGALVEDTIKALREYYEMLTAKRLIGE